MLTLNNSILNIYVALYSCQASCTVHYWCTVVRRVDYPYSTVSTL